MELESEEQRTLSEMYRIIGSDQVARRRMRFVPSWIIEKAEKQELSSN